MSYDRLNVSLRLIWVTILTFNVNFVHAENAEFEAWKKQQAGQFEQFETVEDRAFAEFLRKEWKQFQIFKGNVRDATPKPADPPKIRNEILVMGDKKESPVKRAAGHNNSLPLSNTRFFGHPVKKLTIPTTSFHSGDLLSSEGIADTWTRLARLDHRATLSELASIRQRLALGDWGTLQLIDQLLEAQIQNENQRTFYLWFLLTKLGFDARVGYTQTQLVLLLPTKNKLYGIRYSDIADKRYYMFPESDDSNLLSYDVGSHDAQGSPFDFSLTQLIKPTGFINRVDIEYRYHNETNPIALQYDLGFSTFLATYPQIDLDLYFTAGPKSPVYESLREQLQPRIKGMPPREALSYLLLLTQFLFDYKTDTEQFGQEKYLVVEESLYYGTNDCEDRSIFLAWLIHDILQMEVIVLDYPGHIALAVRTQITPEDDLVSYKGRKFVIVDPTYLGAEVGKVLSSVAGIQPDVIEVGYPNSPFKVEHQAKSPTQPGSSAFSAL